MHCPHCGAQMEKGVPSCALCGSEINYAQLAGQLTARADEALSAGEYARAAAGYTKALELQESEELLLKLGNAYDKQGEKRAAGYYIKVLEKDFANDKAHNLLIAFYTKHSALKDLRAWYSKASGDAAPIAQKYINIIDAVIKFRSEPLPGMDEYGKSSQGEDYTPMGMLKKNGIVYASLLCGMAIIVMGAITGVRGGEDSDIGFFDPRATQFFVMGGILLMMGTTMMMVKMFKNRKGRNREKLPGIDKIMKEVIDEAKKNPKK